MDVAPSSYRQNLFLDPIALYFLNLETSATQLARVLLVSIYAVCMCMYSTICKHTCGCIFEVDWGSRVLASIIPGARSPVAVSFAHSHCRAPDPFKAKRDSREAADL